MLDQLWIQWGTLAAAALLLATAFAALVYMLGHLLNNEKMIAFGKMEVGEVVFSAILIVMTLGILAAATQAAGLVIMSVYPGDLAVEYCGPTYDNYFNDHDGEFPCHMRVARIYLDRLYSEGKLFNWELLRIHMWYSLFQNIGLSSDFHEHSSGSVQFTPLGSVFSIPSSVYSYMFEFGMKSMVIIRFQQFLLNFINYSLYPVLVVLGLILRTFPFSRRLGGLLMAIGISMFFIFPMFYVFGGIVFQNIAMKSPYYQDSGSNPYDIHSPEVITSMDFDPSQFYEQLDFFEEDEDLLSGEFDAEKLNNEYFNEELYPDDVNYHPPDTDTPLWSDIKTVFEGIGSAFNQLFYAVDFTGLIVTNEDFIDGLIGPGGVIDATARFVFFSLFFSLLSVFATVGAIRSLSPLLGGDIELAGLTHLI